MMLLAEAFRPIYFFFVACLFSLGCAAEDVPMVRTLKEPVVLDQATLIGLQGSRSVSLPNILDTADFPNDGGVVIYRLDFDNPSLPDAPQGIFIGKVSLSGEVLMNGQSLGRCANGPLEVIRCAYKPNLFYIPQSLWQIGQNSIEIHVYATQRQTNGLSLVNVGDYAQLNANNYRFRAWIQTDLVELLTWLSLLLGILGTLVGLILRQKSVYLWFGITSIANAIGNLNSFVSQPIVSTELFSWVIYSARLSSVAMFLLTLISFFNRDSRIVRRAGILYALLGPVVLALTTNNRLIATALYIPLLIIGLIVLGKIVYWTSRHPQPRYLALTLLAGVIYATGAYDWMRLAGHSNFEGVLWVPYAFSGMLLFTGGLLIHTLATSLAHSLELSTQLESRVKERTAQLEVAHAQLMVREIENSREDERNRMLQDLHDGFGTQLTSARLLAEQNEMTSEELVQVLQECMSDLYLVVDVLGNPSGDLVHAMADFKFRTRQRLSYSDLATHWNLQIDDMPPLPPRAVLQILRIAQEALNNTLKHARANNLWIDAVYTIENRCFTLRIADDGIGCQPESKGNGKGQTNMKIRALSIGGDLNVSSTQSGTQVLLLLTLTT